MTLIFIISPSCDLHKRVTPKLEAGGESEGRQTTNAEEQHAESVKTHNQTIIAESSKINNKQFVFLILNLKSLIEINNFLTPRFNRKN